MSVSLLLGDCLEHMQEIPAASIDMVLCDLPYGTTACAWDSVIPFRQLWAAYRRVAKPNAAIVLTASQPFTTQLIASNLDDFRYCWVWDKVNRYTGSLNAGRMPLKRHEDVAVFYRALPTYNKQFRKGKAYTATGQGHGAHVGFRFDGERRAITSDGNHNPCSVLEIEGHLGEDSVHPTQKPVALMDYFIRTYTNAGETVLDNTMGSGTTGVACVKADRNFIGIERDPAYFAIAEGRVRQAQSGPADMLLGLTG